MKHLPPKRRTEIRVEIAKKVSDAMKIVRLQLHTPLATPICFNAHITQPTPNST